jgi:hypothetical protein
MSQPAVKYGALPFDDNEEEHGAPTVKHGALIMQDEGGRATAKNVKSNNQSMRRDTAGYRVTLWIECIRKHQDQEE